MAQLREFYRAKADALFKANMVNDPDDGESMVAVCLKLMEDNGVPITDDEDEWLEFVYRAGEICELQEKGYYYHRVKKADGSWGFKLETKEA